MIAYHFCFDLAWNGWLVADFVNDWRWIWFRTPILGSFLFIAGVSLGLAETRGQGNAQFWRRVGIIAGAAALVSLGSYVMFPESFIYFGVLHAIALMSVLARPVARRGAWTIALGLVVLAIGITVQHPLFDRPVLHWIGLMTVKPRTEDYVPLFPWFGVLLIGAGAGAWIVRHRRAAERLGAWQAPPVLGWTAWLGRHSLAVYLLHQPLLLGAMLLVRHLLQAPVHPG
ncbi:MAG: DUF1624 domain-containing protein [Betaproteobacteria bacterium]|nr:DUF1624 domain-containing protein [Betaproteobacteria bacterium]